MPFTLPALPYKFDALEPHIDAKTMEIHSQKHHKAYVDNLNKALEAAPEFANLDIVTLLRDIKKVPDAIRQAVINNGGGHHNHSLFWQIMGPGAGGEPTGQIGDAIKAAFGDFAKFKDTVKNNGLTQFGSGWSWLVVNPASGKLEAIKRAEPGQPADGRPRSGAGRGRVGTRLLPEVSEPPRRLRRRVVEHGELESGRGEVCGREGGEVVATHARGCARLRLAPPLATRTRRSAAQNAGVPEGRLSVARGEAQRNPWRAAPTWR